MKTGTSCPRQFGDHAPLISGPECMGLGVRAISKEKLLLWTSPHFAGCPRYGSSSPQWACTESSKAQGAWLPHLDFIKDGAAWSHPGMTQLAGLLPGMHPRQRAAVGVRPLQRASAGAMPSRAMGAGPTPAQPVEAVACDSSLGVMRALTCRTVAV